MLTRALPYYEFSNGIYEIDEFDCVSIFVIVGEERALVLDAGNGIGDLRWVIENRITDKPYDVVLTHNHGDHIGGAGFFDHVWIHESDYDWSNLEVPPTLEGRKWYAKLISERENKNYAYDVERDIRQWEKTPEKHILRDGQVFDLGGRKVTFYHCPGHTAGECVAIDDKSRILFVGDACNCNYLLGTTVADNVQEVIRIAENGLERIYAMQGSIFEKVYNSHHDFRGFGSPLKEDVLPNLITCLKKMREGTVSFKQVPDSLGGLGTTKIVAEYKNVQVSCVGKDIL